MHISSQIDFPFTILIKLFYTAQEIQLLTSAQIANMYTYHVTHSSGQHYSPIAIRPTWPVQRASTTTKTPRHPPNCPPKKSLGHPQPQINPHAYLLNTPSTNPPNFTSAPSSRAHDPSSHTTAGAGPPSLSSRLDLRLHAHCEDTYILYPVHELPLQLGADTQASRCICSAW